MLLQGGHTPTTKITPPHIDPVTFFGQIAILWMIVITLTCLGLWYISTRKTEWIEVPKKEDEETAAT